MEDSGLFQKLALKTLDYFVSYTIVHFTPIPGHSLEQLEL